MTNIKLRFPGQSTLFSGAATSDAGTVFIGSLNLPIMDELGFVPLSPTGAKLLFKVFSQRYERGSILVTTNLPFDEWTEVFGSKLLTKVLLDRLTHHAHLLTMNGDNYRLRRIQDNAGSQPSDEA